MPEAAKDDPRIKGIYLRKNGNGGVAGSALLEELREAIVDFKQSGKFVVAYNETYCRGSITSLRRPTEPHQGVILKD